MPGPAPGSLCRPPAEAGAGQTCQGPCKVRSPWDFQDTDDEACPHTGPLFHLSDKYPYTTAPTSTPMKKQVDVILFRPLR